MTDLIQSLPPTEKSPYTSVQLAIRVFEGCGWWWVWWDARHSINRMGRYGCVRWFRNVLEMLVCRGMLDREEGVVVWLQVEHPEFIRYVAAKIGAM